jgi:uncharacterized iron-regulated membrane protein
VKPLLLRLHFYAGVLVAPFLVVAAVTGLLYRIRHGSNPAGRQYLSPTPIDTQPQPADSTASAHAARRAVMPTRGWDAPGRQPSLAVPSDLAGSDSQRRVSFD